MVARGEFAYLVAQTAEETDIDEDTQLISQKAFAVVVWALIMTTVTSPLAFGKVLEKYAAKERARRPPDDLECQVRNNDCAQLLNRFADSFSPKAVEVRVEGHKHAGLLRELVDALFELQLEVPCCAAPAPRWRPHRSLTAGDGSSH